MSYAGAGGDAGAVPELMLSVADEVDYVKLPQCEDSEPSSPRVKCGVFCRWIRLVSLLVFLGVLAAVFLKWIGPFVMDKEIMPIINWETSAFSIPVLSIILFFSVALFPTLLLPSTPSMWVVGMTFGYGFGFLLIMPAVAIGVSLPFFIGHLFYHKMQAWFERYPIKASVIRLAGEGDWMNQFQAVVLIRLSPFPYVLYNYCAVATDVKFGPYLCGSIVGMIPDAFIAIYTGILIRTLADASHEHRFLSKQQIALDVIGFVTAATTTVICTIVAKRRLSRIQTEEDMLLPRSHC